MRKIYLSPHLDDAVLSAGGLIFDETRAGRTVEIWTFMCGVPGAVGDLPRSGELTDFARHLHGLWGTSSAEETVRIRRAEDLRAAAIVGAKVVHFDFLDCIYRRGRKGEALYPESVFVPLNPLEADLPAQLAQTIVGWIRPDDTLVCQLAIGGHVDHEIVREAAEMALRVLPLQPPLLYLGDIPYILDHPEQLESRIKGMGSQIYPISEEGLDSWLNAIEAYASQQSSLFEIPGSMRKRVRDYWSEIHGIRLWTSNPPVASPGGTQRRRSRTRRKGLDSTKKP